MGKLLKIVRIGEEVGVILPPEVLAELKAQLGDEVWVAKEPAEDLSAGSVQKARDEEMAVARGVMRDYAAALRELAK